MPAMTRSQARNNAVAAVADVAAPVARDGGRGARGRHAAGRVDREVVGAGGRAVRGGRGARQGGRAGPNANRGAGVVRANDINRRLAGPAAGNAAIAVGRGGRRRVGIRHRRIPLANLEDIMEFMPQLFAAREMFEDERNIPHPNPSTLRPPPRHYPRSMGMYRCRICMHCFLEKEPTAIPRCGHMFCAQCIRGRQEPHCPHCLEEYDPNTLTRIYLNYMN